MPDTPAPYPWEFANPLTTGLCRGKLRAFALAFRPSRLRILYRLPLLPVQSLTGVKQAFHMSPFSFVKGDEREKMEAWIQSFPYISS